MLSLRWLIVIKQCGLQVFDLARNGLHLIFHWSIPLLPLVFGAPFDQTVYHLGEKWAPQHGAVRWETKLKGCSHGYKLLIHGRCWLIPQILESQGDERKRRRSAAPSNPPNELTDLLLEVLFSPTAAHQAMASTKDRWSLERASNYSYSPSPVVDTSAMLMCCRLSLWLGSLAGEVAVLKGQYQLKSSSFTPKILSDHSPLFGEEEFSEFVFTTLEKVHIL